MTRAGRRLARQLSVVALTTLALLLMGLGNGGDANRSTIPLPERNYSVTVSDSKGRSIDAERFTWDGKVYFKATYGSASITLPFEKLSALNMQPQAEAGSPNLIAANAVLKSGETVAVALDRTTKCYGTTRFGDYEIFIKDVGSIKFK